MSLLATLLLALQAGAAPLPAQAAPARDTVPRATTPADSARRRRRPTRRIAVTPALERSAFASPAARDLLLRARAARLAQDSALQSYDAKARQRISVGMAVSRVGRERLLMRTENASRVRWSRDVGLWVELTGQRTAFPAIKEAQGQVTNDLSPVPYYPGRESLWFPGSDWQAVRSEVDDREMVHPLATGAEAYYRYALGGSTTLRLGPTQTIQLQELRVTARRPEWRLFVGSFRFDTKTGQLVSAAYRMGAEMDIWQVASEEDSTDRAERYARHLARDSARNAARTALGDTSPDYRHRPPDGDDDDPPAWVKGIISPMRATVSAITVEYGLHDGRFWMPRAHFAEGSAQAGFMRFPLRIEETFSYNSVNGGDPVPPLPPPLDSADAGARGSLQIGAGRPAAADSGASDSTAAGRRRRERARQCAAGDSYVRRQRRGGDDDGGLVVGIRVPCDTSVLARSPDLPGSIYDSGEELFGERDRDELVSALSALQPEWAPARPTVRSGLDLVRYNRVEALSVGALGRQELGRGYAVEALARVGVGDWQPNGELALARTNGQQTLRAAAYRRLAAANDWGAPLGLGASAGALLFGRDEGFYYRTYGAELTRASDAGGPLSWRLFVEHEGPARVETSFAFARGLANAPFPPNIDARRGTVAGAGAALRLSRGVDPAGFRLTTDVRGEAAGGGWDYLRGAADATLSRPLGGALAGALTLGAGSSAGTLPVQRQWYLGNSATVRGQRARADQGGTAYWLGRAELGLNRTGFRPTLFYDVGWAGDRDSFGSPGRPLSGFGVGASALDGIVRFDLAKGVWPARSVRGYLYLDARF